MGIKISPIAKAYRRIETFEYLLKKATSENNSLQVLEYNRNIKNQKALLKKLHDEKQKQGSKVMHRGRFISPGHNTPEMLRKIKDRRRPSGAGKTISATPSELRVKKAKEKTEKLTKYAPGPKQRREIFPFSKDNEQEYDNSQGIHAVKSNDRF